MNEANFPLLFTYLDSPKAQSHERGRFIESLQIINQGVQDGAIRNVVLNEVKERLSRIVDHSWKALINDKHVYGKSGRLSKQDEELYWSITVMGLHDVISAHKKSRRVKHQSEIVAAIQSLSAEILPLSLAVAGLKSKVIKGRAPAPAKPENPNKIVKTCPCCFRAIAVVSGTMVHHGYERPGYGTQTASCFGHGFPPLEISTKGLLAITTYFEGSLVNLNESLAKLPLRKQITYLDRATKVMVAITPADKDWDARYKHLQAELEGDIRSVERTLVVFRRKLAEWAPETPVDPRLASYLPVA